VPVPGVGAGVLTPEGNLAGYVDRVIFGQHLASPLGDPEGLLSTIPAVASALAGVFAGGWLNQPGGAGRRTIVLCAAGVAAVATGLAWDRAFPINKNLWTSSFAVFSAGLAAILLAVAHWGLDVKRWRAWAEPLRAFGRNPLAGYAGSVALDAALTQWMVRDASIKAAIFEHAFASWIRPLAGAEAASLAYALAYVALWGVVLSVMHRRGVFVGI
jgi:predicted acyltransferase